MIKYIDKLPECVMQPNYCIQDFLQYDLDVRTSVAFLGL
jgi:hypothetical protein